MSDMHIRDIEDDDDEFEDNTLINQKIFNEVMRRKEVDKVKFASHWLQDEDNLEKWSKEEIANDPKKQFIEAASKNELDKVKHLVTTCGDEILEAVDTEAYTALHRAASENAQNVFRYLLEKMNSKLNVRTVDGWTPLHCASMWNHAEIVRLLLKNGADINALTNGHLSCLHVACIHPDNLEVMCELLMNPLIKTTVLSQRGESAMELARCQTKHGLIFEEAMDDCLFLSVDSVTREEEQDVCE